MVNRRKLSRAEKMAIMARQGWLCGCGCDGPVWPGAHVEYDHVLARALGGVEALDNFDCLIRHCHRLKTGEDITRIAKAERQARRTGKQKPGRNKRALKGRGFEGWRGFDGTRRGK